MKKKFGDRRDGYKVKESGFDRFLYYIKPRRSDSEVYISREIDVTNLKRFLENKKKENENVTYFHLFATAIAKIVYNRPLLNRFIINGNKFDRNEVTLSFVAKTKFTDDAKEFLTVVRAERNDNLNTLSDKISGNVKKIRNNEGGHADDFVESLGKLPKFVMAIIVWFVKLLDNHDWLPKSLTGSSIYHSTVLMSNLGSIHCGGIYHNLTNFGTNSILVTMGEVKEVAKVVDEKIVTRFVCDFGITLDERIADGVYFAKSVNLLEYILDNPVLLEDEVDAKVNIDNNN